ncbi:hypothetical protein [Pseudemcibacter aquimaris]|uniref:hypothetical protein n=1 Tax=Pseudemcibacter aquimaris TaxID=2857064 RepID=UPI0020112133|nr:hypothetical protein [Pseudemcibacter aquimaris]MCC3859644.1 hypothetical protein [Pseudemcibacter aquimaris]WDU60039.1 hypothetical protein KW060_07185 [Pseudemcibacter aquimaris]
MSLRNIDNKVFSYKFLRTIMMGFGAFMIAAGPAYSYFVYTQVGVDGLPDALFEFITGILAFPAGFFICVTGKKLRNPIMNTDQDNDSK